MYLNFPPIHLPSKLLVNKMTCVLRLSETQWKHRLLRYASFTLGHALHPSSIYMTLTEKCASYSTNSFSDSLYQKFFFYFFANILWNFSVFFFSCHCPSPSSLNTCVFRFPKWNTGTGVYFDLLSSNIIFPKLWEFSFVKEL